MTAHEAHEAAYESQRYAADTIADVCRTLGLDGDADRGAVLAAIERLRLQRDELREMHRDAVGNYVASLRERDEARAEAQVLISKIADAAISRGVDVTWEGGSAAGQIAAVRVKALGQALEAARDGFATAMSEGQRARAEAERLRDLLASNREQNARAVAVVRAARVWRQGPCLNADAELIGALSRYDEHAPAEPALTAEQAAAIDGVLRAVDAWAADADESDTAAVLGALDAWRAAGRPMAGGR